MTRRRDGNYLWVTWLAKLMAGEVSCAWAAWFRTHYTEYRKAPSDFHLALWTMQHTQLLAELVAERAGAGETTRQEAQGFFRVRLSPTLVIAGKPDLVTCNGAGDVVVYDAKTGKPRHSDVIQVMLYMLCLPCAFPTLRRKPIQGCLVYADGHETRIPAGAIDSAFKRTARYFADLVDAEAAPTRVPSPHECRYCDLTSADCSQRIEWIDGNTLREAPACWEMASLAA